MKLPLIAACLIAGSTWSFANADVTTSTTNQKTAPRPYTVQEIGSVRGTPATVSTKAAPSAQRQAPNAKQQQVDAAQQQRYAPTPAEQAQIDKASAAQRQANRRRTPPTAASTLAYKLSMGGSPGSTGPHPMVVAAPLNDDCSAPIAISGPGPFATDTTGATTSPQQSGSCPNATMDIWYVWTAGSTGNCTMAMCGGPSYDSVIAAYAGGVCPGGPELACNDDGCPFPLSQMTFPVTSGNTYMLQVGGWNGNFGPGAFTMNVTAAQPSDDCATPNTIVGLGSFPFDTTGMTTGSQQPSCAFSTNDMWFQWTAPSTGNCFADTCGSTFDTILAMYDGAGCPVNPSIGCNDQGTCGGFGSSQSSLVATVTAGNTYTIQVGGWNNNFGPGTLNLNVLPPAPFDDCSLPAPIAGLGSFPFDTTTMTTGPQMATCSTVTNDMWFQWTAPSSGMCIADTCGSSFDTVLAAFDGGGCPINPSIACNDQGQCGGFFTNQSVIIFPVISGNTYSFEVGGWFGAFGPGSLNVNVVLPPANDDCTAATVVAGFGSFPFDNTVASTGIDGQNEALCTIFGTPTVAQDVWYQWTAPASGQVSFDTCGGGIDTKIAVYAGTGCPVSGTAIGCDDDGCGYPNSRVLFTATAGTTYTLQIGLYPFGALGGAGSFELIQALPPANDDCSTATAISGTGSFPYDITFATTGVDGQSESLCSFYGSTSITFDAWFAWTAPASGCTIIDVCGSGLDGKMAIYPGTGCPTAGSSIACSDDVCGLAPQVRFTAVAGSTYTIQLGTWPFGAVGNSGFMNIAQIPAGVGNDECSAATVVVGTGTFPYDNSAAGTGCEGQDTTCGGTIFNDVWFTWTAPMTGYATYSTCGGLSAEDTILAAYPGSGCPAPGSALACSDDGCGIIGGPSNAFWFVTAGSTYTLQLGDWGGTPGGVGFFSLDVQPPPGPCDPWDDAVSDNGIGFTNGGDLVWLSKFGNPGVTTTINSVDVAWGSGPWPSAGVPNGDPSDVFIWQDGLSQDGDPSDATLLVTVPTTIQNVDTDIMNNIALPSPLTVTGLFFVGTHCQHPPVDFSTFPPTGFPLPLDQSVHVFPDVSWLCGNIGIGAVSDYAVLTNNLQQPVSMDNIGFPGQHLLRVNCSFGPATYTCTPGDPGINSCPCSNPPTGTNRGCNNKGNTGGASITGSGTASVASSSLTFTTAGENATVGSVLIQGTAFNAGINFGHGVRCTAGQIKRLYIKIAAGGSITAPGGGDPSIPTKSASLGSIINPGDTRYYSVYYRDTTLLLPGCPVPANQFNVSNTAIVVWQP